MFLLYEQTISNSQSQLPNISIDSDGGGGYGVNDVNIGNNVNTSVQFQINDSIRLISESFIRKLTNIKIIPQIIEEDEKNFV